ncbi:MAG: RhuM family protein [Desulfobacteraceae bacterium]|nr:RhuM family protein [Desulfobacteraceae bacterium]
MSVEKSDIVIYQSESGAASLEVHLDHETVWLTQKQMSVLFGKDVRTVNEHIKNIFKEEELDELSVIRKFRITASDGKTYDTAHFNLDVIISVGYRVKSAQGTRFRQWATQILRDHIVKGYTVNEQRLREESAKLQEMRQTMELLARTLTAQELVTDTGRDVLRVLNDYAYALTKPISSSDSLHTLKELFHVLYWLARSYSPSASAIGKPLFDITRIPQKDSAVADRNAEQLARLQARLQAEQTEKDARLAARDAELARTIGEISALKARIQEYKQRNSQTPDDHDYSEAETRDYFIDLLLKESGWDLKAPDVLEYPVVGMPGANW